MRKRGSLGAAGALALLMLAGDVPARGSSNGQQDDGTRCLSRVWRSTLCSHWLRCCWAMLRTSCCHLICHRQHATPCTEWIWAYSSTSGSAS